MDISGGLLAKNVMPYGEHKRCLTCKNVMQPASGLIKTTHNFPPTGMAREITLHPDNFYQKENPLFDEQMVTYAADFRPLLERRVDLHRLSDTIIQ